MEETGELRDINRHYYSKEEIAEAVKQPVVRRLFALMEFRSSYPAFNGVFHLQYSNDSNVAMCWRDGRSEEHTSELQSLMRISYAVFCLKKKKHNEIIIHNTEKQKTNT